MVKSRILTVCCCVEHDEARVDVDRVLARREWHGVGMSAEARVCFKEVDIVSVFQCP